MLVVGLVQNALKFLKNQRYPVALFLWTLSAVCQDSFNLWFMMSPEVMILKYHTDGYCSMYVSELHEYTNTSIFTIKVCFPFHSLAKTSVFNFCTSKLTILAKIVSH